MPFHSRHLLLTIVSLVLRIDTILAQENLTLGATDQTQLVDACRDGPQDLHTTGLFGTNEDYPSFADCQWTLHCPDATTPLTVTFERVFVEADFDFIRVYDGIASEPSHVLNGFTITNKTVEMEADTVVIQLTSDLTVQSAGFRAHFVCAGADNDDTSSGSGSGSWEISEEPSVLVNTVRHFLPSAPPPPPPPAVAITQEGNPTACHGSLVQADGTQPGSFVLEKDYSEHQDGTCTYYFGCPIGSAPLVSFSHFSTEADYDFVTAHDGPNARASVLSRYHGDITPEPLQGTENTLFLELRSDSGVSGDGFAGKYVCEPPGTIPPPVPDPCTSGLILENSGRSHSSGTIQFGKEAGYGNGHDCTWRLTCSAVAVIPRVTFHNIRTEAQNLVLVYDGSSETAVQIGRFHGSVTPSPLEGSMPTVLIRMTSNTAITSDEFSASYECVPAPPPPSGIACGEAQIRQEIKDMMACAPQGGFCDRVDPQFDHGAMRPHYPLSSLESKKRQLSRQKTSLTMYIYCQGHERPEFFDMRSTLQVSMIQTTPLVFPEAATWALYVYLQNVSTKTTEVYR
jgi:hypothetical protein